MRTFECIWIELVRDIEYISGQRQFNYWYALNDTPKIFHLGDLISDQYLIFYNTAICYNQPTKPRMKAQFIHS